MLVNSSKNKGKNVIKLILIIHQFIQIVSILIQIKK